MLALRVQVVEARDRTGVAALRDGSKVVSTGPVVASATQAIAARRANPECDPLRLWGHPPFGAYRLLHVVHARPDLGEEYGTHLLLFEPESGQGLEAESFGRLALLAYGGPAGRDGRMRRTQGGLRLTDRMLLAIVERLRPGAGMTLNIEPLRAPAWWQFWKRPEESMPLSGTVPALLSPPVDEVSVIEELLRDPALAKRRRPRPDPDDSRDHDRDRSSSGGSGSGRDTFQGKGGESAGGGASGGWDSASGRGPGVDQAGRIVAGAAAAATLAAVAGAAAVAAAQSGADRASGDAGADSGTNAGTDSSTGTNTSTAY